MCGKCGNVTIRFWRFLSNRPVAVFICLFLGFGAVDNTTKPTVSVLVQIEVKWLACRWIRQCTISRCLRGWMTEWWSTGKQTVNCRFDSESSRNVGRFAVEWQTVWDFAVLCVFRSLRYGLDCYWSCCCCCYCGRCCYWWWCWCCCMNNSSVSISIIIFFDSTGWRFSNDWKKPKHTAIVVRWYDVLCWCWCLCGIFNIAMMWFLVCYIGTTQTHAHTRHSTVEP